MAEPTPSEGEDARRGEAEETLAAIRAGEIDAFVVDGPGGERIYSLESPDQPYRVFIERMQEGAVTLAENGVIVYANAFFAGLLKAERARLIGLDFSRFVSAEDRPLFDALLATGVIDSARATLNLVDAEGAVLPAAIAVSPLPTQRPRTCAAVVRDLRDQERLRLTEEARATAEAANLAKDHFLATLGHELRTPLNAILGWAHILRQAGGDPTTLAQGLDTIERNARAQAKLIEDLLDVSRIISGKLRLETRALEAQRVVTAAVDALAPTALQKGVTLRAIVEDEVSVHGDGTRLEQAVWNLVSNAVKFTPAGGHVEVFLRRREGFAEIVVRDDGNGIPSAFLPHLFEAFRQADSAATTRGHGGLGLGLSIVRQLVEMHGGAVRAASDGEGRGSTFTIELPLHTGEVPTAGAPLVPRERAPRPRLDRTRVLVVDDERDSRELTRRILTDAHALVRTADSVAAALAQLEGFEPHVLVSDLAMPGEDGYALIREIRARGYDAADLPAVALTAFAGEDHRRALLLAGFQQYVAKPLDPDALVRVVARLAPAGR